jgi:cell division protein FtsI (penicillin-binding protein 3)
MELLREGRLPSKGGSKGRQRIAVRIAGAMFVCAVMSQAYVQLVNRGNILARAKATDKFVISRVEFAKRGAILTSDGKPLAQDDDTYEFNVQFSRVPRTDAFFMALGEASGIPASELAQLAASGVNGQTWRKQMSSAQARDIQAVKMQWRADGVSIRRTDKRAYPLGPAAAGFVGYMREAGPVAGLELSMNKVLGGVNGLTVGLVDRVGAFLPTRLDPDTKQKKDGENVTLTIDSNLQQEAMAALKIGVESNNADQGVAIVMDPHTGDILAMANWPSFNPNDSGQGIEPKQQTDYNPAYMSALEPGSTFKILTLAKALDVGVVKPTDHFYCRGSLVVWAGRSISCAAHGGSSAHGDLTPESAIARSCNVWAATWAQLIGYQAFVKYIEDLGLLSKSHLGVPLETKGLFNYDEYAKPLQLATLGFGQSVSCTPIGLASAFSMIGNGGRRPTARLIKKIGSEERPLGDQPQLVSKETADRVLGYMESVFTSEHGTGHSLQIPGYSLAGKTGTAQRVRKVGGGGYVANFVGFVPAQNPRAMILVMVDNPKAGKYYGGSVAGPVFRDIAKAVIRRYAIPPSTQTPPPPRAKKN